MKTTRIVAGNWKLNKTQEEVKSFFDDIRKANLSSSVRKVIAVSPALLDCAVKGSSGTGVEIFCQNSHWANCGAFTGETSIAQIKDFKAAGTLIAHSERRQYFGETDETASNRALFALKEGLKVIYCVGENLLQRQSSQTNEILKTQMESLFEKLSGLTRDQLNRDLVIAYEPVWAIGTGLTATNEQIEQAHLFLYQLCQKADVHASLLYGGSVKADNFAQITKIPHVLGGLIGGASLKASDFRALVESVSQ